MVICFVVATKLTTAADAIFIQYTSPVYVALLSWPLLRERVTWRDGVACVGVLVGMVLFFREGLSARAQVGNPVAVVSSFGAAGLPLALRADQRRSPHAASWRAAPRVALARHRRWATSRRVLLCPRRWWRTRRRTRARWVILAAARPGADRLALRALWPRRCRGSRRVEGALLPTLEPILNPVWVALGTGEIPGAVALVGGGLVLGSVLLQALGGASGAQAAGRADLTEA